MAALIPSTHQIEVNGWEIDLGYLVTQFIDRAVNLEADWPGADVVFGVHHLRCIVSFDEDAPSFFVGKLSSPQNRSTCVKIHTT